jgi:K+-sensing histidine kinase KdpD
MAEETRDEHSVSLPAETLTAADALTASDTLSPPDGSRYWVSMIASVVLPLAAALVLVPFRDHFANAAAALVLVAVVVGVAAFGERPSGWIASVSSCVWFDFFLTRPYERFSIAAAKDVETTVALLVVGVAVTEIAVRSRRHFAVAMEEGNYLALIHDVSDLVARGASAEAVIAAARDDLVELLLLRDCRFESTSSPRRRAQLLRNGEVELGEQRFDVARDGLPDDEVDLVVQSNDREYGVFVMGVGARRAVSIEQRVVALVLADQVGAALAASGSN